MSRLWGVGLARVTQLVYGQAGSLDSRFSAFSILPPLTRVLDCGCRDKSGFGNQELLLYLDN